METKIKIGNTEVVLTDIENGKGSVIVRDYEYGSFSYAWGAMGYSLKDFLLGINSDYFAGKLCTDDSEFSIRRTLANLRREIKENLPWYEFMEGQKVMREVIKDNLSHCVSADHFVSECLHVHKYLSVPEYDYRKEREFKEKIEVIFNNEPWNYISNDKSKQYQWLAKIHREIKKKLIKTK